MAGHLKRDCPQLQQSRKQKQRRPQGDDSAGTVTITLASGGEVIVDGGGRDGGTKKGPSGKKVQGGFRGRSRGSQDRDGVTESGSHGTHKGGRSSRGRGRGRGRGGRGGDVKS